MNNLPAQNTKSRNKPRRSKIVCEDDIRIKSNHHQRLEEDRFHAGGKTVTWTHSDCEGTCELRDHNDSQCKIFVKKHNTKWIMSAFRRGLVGGHLELSPSSPLLVQIVTYLGDIRDCSAIFGTSERPSTSADITAGAGLAGSSSGGARNGYRRPSAFPNVVCTLLLVGMSMTVTRFGKRELDQTAAHDPAMSDGMTFTFAYIDAGADGALCGVGSDRGRCRW
jgi:hypothetical protein